MLLRVNFLYLELPSDKFNMVDTFVIDCMHGLLQNTARRFIYSLQEGRSKGRIQNTPFQAMDKIWLGFRFPIEFARPYPQSLNMKNMPGTKPVPGINTWKATQLRMWTLYGSCLVLHETANRRTTTAWRHLVLAMRILCSKEMCCNSKYNEMARDFIVSFQEKIVEQFPKLTQMSLHVLRHLAKDCMRLKRPADDFSCFWGENTLKHIKNLVHTSKNPLGNITKGLRANAATFHKKQSEKFRPRFLHRISDLNTEREIFYRAVQTESFRIVGEKVDANAERDAVFSMANDQITGPSILPERSLHRQPTDTDENAYFFSNNKVYKAVDIVRMKNSKSPNWKDDVFIEAHKYETTTSAYHVHHGINEISSSEMGIYFIRGMNAAVSRIRLSDVEKKCVSHLIDGLRYAYTLL